MNLFQLARIKFPKLPISVKTIGCTFFLILSGFSHLNFAQENPFNAPFYWSVYEYHILKEQAGESSNYIPESVLQANVDWVDAHLKDLGCTMICIDGWGDVNQLNENGYRTSHSSKWTHDYAWWSNHLQERGMTLGMYGNPLWINVGANDQRKIVGTDIRVSSLIDTNENALWFTWVQVDRPGAEEYVKGYFKFLADLGITYYRVDFLSWFEDGWDRYLGRTGPERPREHYETALQWMREAADENGMFLSLVMPHLYEEAVAEMEYGHMFRINEDTGEGGWWKWSEKDRGIKRKGWSVYANPFDGLTYWSYLAGRGEVILDPDFLRLNTFANDDERKSVVSLCLMAGGALTVSDQVATIGNDLWIYQNKELLALNADGFVGKPLTNNPTDQNSQIWTGQLSDGSWIVGLFNRENTAKTRTIDFSSMGITGNAKIRDLWKHQNLESASTYSESIPPHSCRILKVVAQTATLDGPEAMFIDSIVTAAEGTDEKHGTALVSVLDGSGNPVKNASVTVQFSASYSEQVSGVTGEDGSVILKTSKSKTGDVRVNVCVISLEHPTLIYAADMDRVACVDNHFFVGGTFNNWSLKEMKYKDGSWRYDSLYLEAGSYELKFANTVNWTGDDWGNASGLNGSVKLTTGGGANVSFSVAGDGYYSITFDDLSLSYSISLMIIEKVNDEMYLGGTFNDWTLEAMTFDGESWRIDNLPISAGVHSLKFANTSDWTGNDWGNAAGLAGTAKLSTGGDPNITFKLTRDGAYTILFNDVTLKYSIAETGVLEIKDQGRQGLLIYPNPFSDLLNISNPSASADRVRVVDLSGKLMLEQKQAGKNVLKLDTSTLDRGIYLLIIDAEGSENSFKIIKN